MYASIMRNESLPFGKARFAEQQVVELLMNSIAKFEKIAWRDIFNSLTKKFGLFLAECNFSENPHNLEPII